MQLTAQRAQAKLGKLNPSCPLANHEASWKGKVWLQGSGKADLPNDDPPDSWDVDLPIPQDSLIRVYLDVEMDYINERGLMLSAAVDCGRLHPDDPDDDYDPRKNIISFSTAVDETRRSGRSTPKLRGTSRDVCRGRVHSHRTGR